MSADVALTSDLAMATSGAMSQLRGIVICLLSLVLVAGQMAMAAQASSMALEGPSIAAEAPAAMAIGGMSGDCDDCGATDATIVLCPANCCASCSTAAAVLSDQPLQGIAAENARSVWPSRLLLGMSPSPHPTPPKLSVLS